jgi:Putative Ig domain
MPFIATLECKKSFRSTTRPVRTGLSWAALLVLATLTPCAPSVAGTLYIGGSPATTVTVPKVYYFRPSKSGSDAANAKFIVKNLPHWLTFNPTLGSIRGVATTSLIGTYKNIDIGVTTGKETAWMRPFAITVHAASGSPAPPKISGTPPTSVTVGTAYSFQPTASGPSGAKLTFSINVKPSWTSFDTTNGRLSGTPQAANVGTVSNIVIKASDGTASASLPAFSISVKQAQSSSVTLSWQPSAQNTDGSALTDLAGYQIKYGTNPGALSQTIQIANPGLTTYVITNLAPGTYYFGMLSYTVTGVQSQLSNLASKVVQ